MDSRPIPAVRRPPSAQPPSAQPPSAQPPSAQPPSATGERVGAIALPPRHGMARLYVAILGLLLVVIAGFVAASRVENRTGAGGSPAASASPGAAAGSGRPVALDPAHLPQYVGRPVQGRSALVQSIAGVGPAGQPDARRFFVGSSPRQQILVVIDTAANPAVAIVAGQRYSFSGVLRKYGGNPAPLHITQGATASVAQLGYYVEVADPHLVKAG